jgi:hypothetical protein
MSSNYTGDPVGVQAPATAPEPETAPVAKIPADGEAANVLSISQFVKVLADHVAWLYKPRAKVSAWTQAIKQYRSARLHRRWGIDHLGFPGGQLVHWREGWMSATSVSGAAASDAVADMLPVGSGWYIQTTKAGAGNSKISVRAPDTIWPWSRYVKIEAADLVGDYARLWRLPQAQFTVNNALAMEWSARVDTPHADVRIAMGWNALANLAGNLTPLLGATLQFTGDYGTSTAWTAEDSTGGGASAVTTAVVMTNTWMRFRVEWQGANVADDSVSKALFFIDGALVGTLLLNTPDGAASPWAFPVFSVERVGATGGSATLYVSPVRYSGNIAGTDIGV